MLEINGYLITSIDSISAYKINGGGFLWSADEVQKFELQNQQENTDLTGKNGQKIGVLKQNKSATLTFTNGHLVQGMMASQTGSPVSLSATKVKFTDAITIGAGGTATTKYKAKGTAGNEIGEIYKVERNVVTKKFTQDSTASATGKFAYDPTTKAITFYSGDVTEGEVLVARYNIDVTNASTVSNTSDTFSDTIEVIIDVTAEEPACHNEYYGQIRIPYLDCSGNFNIIGGEQSVQDFEGFCLASSCAITQKSKFWDFIVYDFDDVV